MAQEKFEPLKSNSMFITKCKLFIQEAIKKKSNLGEYSVKLTSSRGSFLYSQSSSV